jgi:hypothetical protein
MLHISAIEGHVQAPLYKEPNALSTNQIVMLLVYYSSYHICNAALFVFRWCVVFLKLCIERSLLLNI